MSMRCVRRVLAWSLSLHVLLGNASAQQVAPLPPPVSDTPALLPAGGKNISPQGPVTSATPAPKATSSTSASKQFIIYGADLNVRSAFCLLCDDTAAALGRVLRDNARFTLPVIVVLTTPSEKEAASTGTVPAVTVNIGELTHGGFHLQMNAQLRTGFRTEDFARELVRVLLAERILRNHKKLDATRQNGVLPDWLMTGVTQAMEFRSRNKPSVLFAAVFQRGQVYSLDRILSANPAQLDALSRGIYETSTCALVLTLLDQPDGPVRFSRFLTALASDGKPDRELLKQHFPTLATSKNALEKWWTLQMASLATPSAMETMNINETEEALDDVLMLMLPVTKNGNAPAPEAAEKKTGGILGWLKQDHDKQPKPEEPAPAKTEAPEKPQEPTPAKKPGDAAEPAVPEMPKERGPHFQLPGFLNPFGGGKKVIFPFRKSRDPAEKEEPQPEAKDKAKPAKPEAEAGKKKEPAKEEAVAGSLARKPADARSIGGRPDDLPKPPPAVTPKPAAPPLKQEESPPSQPSRLNPLHWFRKDESAPTDSTVPPAPPADASQGKHAEPPATDATPQADKPSPFNPLHWFRKGDEPHPENPSTAPASADEAAGPAKQESKATRPGTLPLEDFALLDKRPDREDILRRCLDRLSALKLRAHPLYRPLIEDYAAIVQQLIQGKEKGAPDKLEALRSKRQHIRDLAAAVESHLDWYEANHTTSLNPMFDDYLKLQDQLQKERFPRNDAISRYLDAVEKEFQE